MARRGYVQLVNGFYDNDKVRDLVRMAAPIPLACIAWRSRCAVTGSRTVSSRAAPCSPTSVPPPEQVRALMDEGMLEEVDEGWIIHDYTVHNRTKEQVLHARADARNAKQIPMSRHCHKHVTA